MSWHKFMPSWGRNHYIGTPWLVYTILLRVKNICHLVSNCSEVLVCRVNFSAISDILSFHGEHYHSSYFEQLFQWLSEVLSGHELWSLVSSDIDIGLGSTNLACDPFSQHHVERVEKKRKITRVPVRIRVVGRHAVHVINICETHLFNIRSFGQSKQVGRKVQISTSYNKTRNLFKKMVGAFSGCSYT